MTLEGLLRAVAAMLDDAGIPYMLTGSVAAAYYAEPRATRDIDLVIDIVPGGDEKLAELLDRLDEAGFYVSREAARDALRRRGQFNAIDPESGWKVDWILRRDRLFSRTEFERRRRVEVTGIELPMTTAEDLILAKLEWARLGGSDLQLRDALAILLQRGDELDRAYIRHWVDALDLGRGWSTLLEEEAAAGEA